MEWAEKEKIIDECLALMSQIYDYSLVGSNCHIVADEGSISDDSIRFCLEEAIPLNYHKATPAQLAIEKRFLLELMKLPEIDRENVC